MLRIAVLLLVLVVVALGAWQSRRLSTRWRVPLYVSIYPIAADESPVTRAYVASLGPEMFSPIDRFFAREAARHGLTLQEPFRTRLQPALAERPPRPSGTSPLSAAVFSLRLRYWAWRVGGHGSGLEDIRVFVLFHDPALTPQVPHSLGLRQGLIGVVYAFAAPEMSAANDVIIAHELLHTVGAGDKYDARDDAPLFPDGYGDPRQLPLYPQKYAELMAGRRVLAPGRFEQPDGLDEVLVGPATAREIRWPP